MRTQTPFETLSQCILIARNEEVVSQEEVGVLILAIVKGGEELEKLQTDVKIALEEQMLREAIAE